MTIEEYQTKAHSFATYGNNKNYPLLGLSEEAGEVTGKVAKFIRKHDGVEPISLNAIYPDDIPASYNGDNLKLLQDLTKELGDVCWMVSEICSAYGLKLEDVMADNIAKLDDRKARGVIIGEGDNR